MSTILVKGWHQLDFKIQIPLNDLKKIDSVMEALQSENLISKWFFLFEEPSRPAIRVRMESLGRNRLQNRLVELSNSQSLEFADSLPFSEYTEGSEMLFNEETVRRFANIMCEVTQLTLRKIKQENQFDTYRILERINHCIFDNMATLSLKSEEYFLVQRFKERTRLPFDGDFE